MKLTVSVSMQYVRSFPVCDLPQDLRIGYWNAFRSNDAPIQAARLLLGDLGQLCP
jgi:hypothetical protein